MIPFEGGFIDPKRWPYIFEYLIGLRKHEIAHLYMLPLEAPFPGRITDKKHELGYYTQGVN